VARLTGLRPLLPAVTPASNDSVASLWRASTWTPAFQPHSGSRWIDGLGSWPWPCGRPSRWNRRRQALDTPNLNRRRFQCPPIVPHLREHCYRCSASVLSMSPDPGFVLIIPSIGGPRSKGAWGHWDSFVTPQRLWRFPMSPRVGDSESRVGKMPTTRVRRLTPLCRRSSGFGRVQSAAMLPREVQVGQQVLGGVLEKLGRPAGSALRASGPRRAAGSSPRRDLVGRTRSARSPRPCPGPAWEPSRARSS
jgi:hypothetical protein